jgi:hypothetical protein
LDATIRAVAVHADARLWARERRLIAGAERLGIAHEFG